MYNKKFYFIIQAMIISYIRTHNNMYEQLYKDSGLCCKPLDSLEQVAFFLENPPVWRSLCKELRPHSKEKIRNIEVNADDGEELHLENPRTFCHFDPDAEPEKRYNEDNLPRTLVCHDLANGYHEDSFLDGSNKYDAYTFYNWAGIDIFCYFSHHLVTVPPLGWINAAHTHGVKVIGTLITEWAEGSNFWKNLLDSETESQNFVSSLVAIAKTLKFDGWLLNLENKILSPEPLFTFVAAMHRALHEELPHAELIWYDSVTVNGSLNWQNGLNHKNKRFFDLCDGIFTNYSWTEENVIESAKLAGDRIRDVYIGIDVWGRNFYGGGQFNVQQAIKVAYNQGLSLAIFSPAWTREGIDPEYNKHRKHEEIEMGATLSFFEKFLLRDRALWDSVWPFLYTRVPCELPFLTSFCRGQGLKRRQYGEVVSPGTWYNLRHMQYQPNAIHGPHGYLLSTIENIKTITKAKASKLSINRENEKRLPHSREYLYTLEHLKLPAVISEGQEHINDKAIQYPQIKEDNPGVTERRSKYEYFKNLFKKKPPKTPVDSRHAILTSDLSDITPTSSGRSMTIMSVCLDLGRSPTTFKRLGLAFVAEELDCLEFFFEDSYFGGACLKVNPCDREFPMERWIRLFYTDFYCTDSLIFCIVTKNMYGYENQKLNVVMRGRKRQELATVTLLGREVPQVPFDYRSVNVSMSPIEPSTPQFHDLRRYIVAHEPGFYVPVENVYGWKVRYYEVRMPGMNIRSVNLHAGEASAGPILLGYFGICEWDKQRDNDNNNRNPVSEVKANKVELKANKAEIKTNKG